MASDVLPRCGSCKRRVATLVFGPRDWASACIDGTLGGQKGLFAPILIPVDRDFDCLCGAKDFKKLIAASGCNDRGGKQDRDPQPCLTRR